MITKCWDCHRVYGDHSSDYYQKAYFDFFFKHIIAKFAL